MNRQIIDWDEIEAEEMQRIAEKEKRTATKRWAKYPRPNPFTEAYGYGSTLYKLKGDMENHELSPITRRDAARNHAKILRQLQDKPLMALRERLIRAGQSGDRVAIAQISAQLKGYSKEDTEAGY